MKKWKKAAFLLIGVVAVPVATSASAVYSYQGDTEVAVAGGGLTGSAAQPSDRNEPVDGQVFLTASLSDSAGRPIVGTVLIYEWPSDKVRESLEPGDAVPVQPLGWTVTDRAGRFAVYADATELAARHGDGNEPVEIELVIQTKDGVELRIFANRHPGHDRTYWRIGSTSDNSIRLVETGNGLVTDSETGKTSEVRMTQAALTRYRAGQLHERYQLDESLGHLLLPSDADDLTSAVAPRHHGAAIWNGAGFISSCSFWTYAGLSAPRPTMTIETQSGLAGSSAYPTYNASSSSTVSTTYGVHYGWPNGPTGSFSANGSQTRTSQFSGSLTPSWGVHHKDYLINWEHQQYDQHCPVVNYVSGAITAWNYYRKTNPYRVTGGSSIRNSLYGDISVNWCQTWAGSQVVKSTSNAATYNSAATLSWGPFTASLASQSGYNSNTTIAYNFPTPSGGTWCGHDTYPANASRVRIK